MPEQKERSYFERRIYDELGFTKKELKISVICDNGERTRTAEISIFNEDEKGNIEIPVYTLDRHLIYHKHPRADPDKPTIYNNRDQVFKITRLKTPERYVDKKTGEVKEKKYDLPAGAGTLPYFPPLLVSMYSEKTPINTLVLTEGYFKAAKGCKHNIPVVGLSSITHVKEKDTEAMYEDVINLIEGCKVKNIIMLYDGDCKNISLSALENEKDLAQRPEQFVASMLKVRELFKDYPVDVYFAHVDSENIEGSPKGLDDLLISEKGNEQAVAADLLSLSRKKGFFYCRNLSLKDKAAHLYQYFSLNNVNSFFLQHEIHLKNKKFKFKGSLYEYNEEKSECLLCRHKDFDNLFRVGDTYYEFVKVPNKDYALEIQMHPRSRETIKEDYGKNALDKIVNKYKAFCNVPNHENYSRVLNDCFNLYNPFEHTPEDGECNTSLAFMRHIFEEHYELGLDYIQLLFQKPTQILPILCLVSKANNTGKSTFIKWLKEIFTQNMALVGNSDFSSDFNSHWIGKILIACEESFIEKPIIMQKIKNLSTANKTSMNRKGKDQGEVDFYGKFILASNEIEHFIYASKHDIRYWVRDIKTPAKDDPNLNKKLVDEIPAFLFFLSNRKLSVPTSLSRMWFLGSQITTAAFTRVVEANRPRNEREIRMFLRQIFLEFGAPDVYRDEPCIIITIGMIHEHVFHKRISFQEINKIITDSMDAVVYTNANGERIARRCAIPQWSIADGQDESPKYEMIKGAGKPFVFYQKHLLTEDEIKTANETKMREDQLKKKSEF